MSFTDNQIAALKAPLNRAHVKSRSQAGRSLSYIEGWHAIAEANRIFGFDGWNRETTDIRPVCDPYQDAKGNWRVSYMAKVRITVAAEKLIDGVVRNGCGYGSGIDKDLGQAHESALKEAETDAMKRALMTFGNPFGLALYDKEQANVAVEPEPVDESKIKYIATCAEIIKTHEGTWQELAAWWNADEQKKARHDFGLSKDEVDMLKAEVMARKPAEKEAA